MADTDVETAEEIARKDYKIWQVIGASAAGTAIEWYDFYIFGTLATQLAPKFYPPGAEMVQILLYLSTFAVGFVVRPFGALFFGRIGDLVGRKYAFLITLLIMGICTAAVGILPGYQTIGYFAPALLILFRILQGLALGGEYGGAAIYVAEHVPDKKRGYYTSYIQITATLGLFIAILVVLAVQKSMSPEQFIRNGYRIPFLISVILVAISLYIRVRMKESPIFSGLKAGGKTSTTPLKDALTGWDNWKRILRSLFGATAGQGVVWYTGQFYALFYLTTILKLEDTAARIVIAAGLLLGMPLFIFFGALSDRVGRKRIMMAGCLLAVIFYIPIYQGMISAANTGVSKLAARNDPVTGEPKLSALNAEGKPITVKSDKNHQQLLAAGGVTPARDPNYPLLIFYIFVQMIFVCMVYGPIAAYLVEAFPAKVRYTSLSLPYHIGNGVFGGLLPVVGLYVNSATKDILAGLYYPIAIAALTFVVGSLTLRETRDVRIWDELEAARRGEAEPTPA